LKELAGPNQGMPEIQQFFSTYHGRFTLSDIFAGKSRTDFVSFPFGSFLAQGLQNRFDCQFIPSMLK